MAAVFFLAIGLTIYSAVLFPLFIVVRGQVRRRPVRGEAVTPSVSVVIAARNEAEAIGKKIESVLATDYPHDRREIIVVSDGSTDDTDSIVASYAASGVKLVPALGRGKAEALAAGVRVSHGDVLVFTDANGALDPGALRSLVWPFADASVGGVAGDQRYRSSSPSAIGAGERRYWKFDRLLKRSEGRSGDVVAATGGLYAIRRELFEPIPAGVNDDLFLSTGVIQKGYRLVFASDAVAYESLAPSLGAEVRRKIRIMTRGMRTVWLRRTLLNPFRYGFYSFELFSHKVLRWMLVFPLLTIAMTGPFLWGRGWLYVALSAPLLALYAAGIVGLLLGRTPLGRIPLLSLPAYVCAMNAAALAMAWNVVRGRSIEAWQPGRTPDRLSPDERIAAYSATPARRPDRGLKGGIVALSIVFGVAVAATSQPTIVAALIVVAGVAAILVLRPDTARLVALGLLFSDAAFVAARREGAVRLAAIAVIAAFAVPVLHDFVVRRERIEFVPAFPFLGAYVLVQALSALFATRAVAAGEVWAVGGRAGSSSVLRFTVEGLALYLIITNLIRTREMLRRSMFVLLGVAALLSTLALMNTLSGNFQKTYLGFVTAERIERGAQEIGTEPTDRWETKYGGRRQAGPLRGRPNRWGVALLPLIPVAWVLSRQASGKVAKAATLGALVLALSGLGLTFSRGTFLGLAACVVAMLLFKSLKVRHVLAAAVLGLIFLAAVPAFGGRVLSIRGVAGVLFSDPEADPDASIRGRFTTSAAAILMFIDHPVVGVGPGNYPMGYRQYANRFPVLVHPNDRRPHNLYLGTAAETGVLGLIALGGVCFITLRELFRARRRAHEPSDAHLAAAFIVAVIGLLVNMVTLHAAYIRYFWLYMALAATAAKILGEGRTSAVPTSSVVPFKALATSRR